MDKPSEQRKSTKECGDTDIGVHDYGAGGKREQLNGLWGVASKEVVGLSPTRLITNNYCKEQDSKSDIVDSFIEGGPPLVNVSKPRRVF